MERAEPDTSARGAADLEHEEEVVKEIRAALRGIRFGSVLVKVHDGEVVGIETSTKVRIKGSKPS